MQNAPGCFGRQEEAVDMGKGRQKGILDDLLQS